MLPYRCFVFSETHCMQQLSTVELDLNQRACKYVDNSSLILTMTYFTLNFTYEKENVHLYDFWWSFDKRIIMYNVSKRSKTELVLEKHSLEET